MGVSWLSSREACLFIAREQIFGSFFDNLLAQGNSSFLVWLLWLRAKTINPILTIQFLCNSNTSSSAQASHKNMFNIFLLAEQTMWRRNTTCQGTNHVGLSLALYIYIYLFVKSDPPLTKQTKLFDFHFLYYYKFKMESFYFWTKFLKLTKSRPTMLTFTPAENWKNRWCTLDSSEEVLIHTEG